MLYGIFSGDRSGKSADGHGLCEMPGCRTAGAGAEWRAGFLTSFIAWGMTLLNRYMDHTGNHIFPVLAG